jgi:Tol biopolymer transport system component
MKPVDSSPHAAWKERFRAPAIWSASIAPLRPDRGLLWTTASGTLQVHTWDVPTGTLKQLTHAPGGQTSPMGLSPDGRWVYFLADEHGNEIGHYGRMPYEGGPTQDITPDMSPYSSFGFTISRQGNRFGFVTADREGSAFFVVDLGPGDAVGAPRALCSLRTMLGGATLSSDGSTAIVMSSEKSGKNEFSLVAFDAATGYEWRSCGTATGRAWRSIGPRR